MKSDPGYPIEDPVTLRFSRRPFMRPGVGLSNYGYAKPIETDIFDQPDSELALIHVAGIATTAMNLRLLKTYPHGTGHADAEYLDLDSGEKLRVEWELMASSFIRHRHKPETCDIILCWRDDLRPAQRSLLRKRNPSIRTLDLSKVFHHYRVQRERK